MAQLSFSMDRGRIYPTMPPDPGCLQTVVHKSFPSHLRTTLLLATATVMTTTTATQVLSLSRARAHYSRPHVNRRAKN
ncbi:uncharacterized protein CLUP02_15404 [Colletotrichum lupini]|uniref:Uncharacterized protein n=2 Tax=Colletotrichum acutatum species complex TaxID=2707335 RepID=A0A9Q8WN89_9PEZI|nr:uncharacterized protein CLUP02_15404 [Colletotrichum lupini]XP_060311175.1 uncharacterized protein CCOS01_09853 [Colletotrichum costaricense]KAK1522141.1 hypothetical protein CCOS01_09853 [Colletotrichum costaricense]UQC89873.1 hypothetical protein CLUP02_15404 [Colletotrichum lupini]